jgi:hypothetical protein
MSKKVGLLLCILTLTLPSLAVADSENVQMVPNDVEIRTFFAGASLNFSARIPKGSSAILEVKGPEHEEHLMRKGRRAGLWMNVGKVTVQGAPSVYLCMSTDKALPSNSDPESRWGYPAIERRVHFSGSIPNESSDELFKQFLQLKESGGLYGVSPGSLKVTSGKDGYNSIEGTILLPAKIPPGDYEVRLSSVGGDKVLENNTLNLSVVTKGFPAFLDELAMHHALSYGFLAVIIALATGFAMGFFFKSKGAH